MDPNATLRRIDALLRDGGDVVADVFDVSEDERDAFALAPEVECAVLHWSEHGGAPKLSWRYRTRADVDQFFAADDEEA